MTKRRKDFGYAKIRKFIDMLYKLGIISHNPRYYGDDRLVEDSVIYCFQKLRDHHLERS